ncbi:hypothetical protein WCP94_004139 [Bilophila wadsworthia]
MRERTHPLPGSPQKERRRTGAHIPGTVSAGYDNNEIFPCNTIHDRGRSL